MTRTTCEELAERIVDYVDGELPADEAEIVARHLSECPRCRQIASDLQRSLSLAKVIWEDNLAPPAAAATVRHVLKLRRTSFYVLAAAATILLATGSSLMMFFHRAPQPPALTFAEVQRQVARAGTAAQLLAATRILAQCEGTGSIVKQQYRYILREYAGTPAAASIQANDDLKLGGTSND
jgi:anti-sigma factor RsiW